MRKKNWDWRMFFSPCFLNDEIENASLDKIENEKAIS